MRMPKCSSPRPETRNFSAESLSSTRRATLVSNSRIRRSRICREVTKVPSWPAKGESFTEKVICRVGSSTLIRGKACGSSAKVTVSPMLASAKPATATILPALASFSSTRLRPSKPRSFVILPLTIAPVSFTKAACWPALITPLWMRPITMRPKYSE